MRATRVLVLFALGAALAACAKERQVPAADEGPVPGSTAFKTAQALTAGPDWLGGLATIAQWPPLDTGQFIVLRAGAGGWTCFPDLPTTPGNDPLCVDDEFLRWVTAWKGHAAAPSLQAMAIAYAFKGMQVASEKEPLKASPDSGKPWVRVPPSVLIATPNAAAVRATRPASGPWVLWAGTPWALTVVPVAAAMRAVPAPASKK